MNLWMKRVCVVPLAATAAIVSNGCGDVAGRTPTCLGSLAETCEPLEGEAIEADLDSPGVMGGPREALADVEVSTDCFERLIDGYDERLLVIEDQVWLGSAYRRAVVPSEADAPFDWLESGRIGPEDPRTAGPLSYGAGKLGYLDAWDCSGDECDRAHLWAADERGGEFEEVVSEPAWPARRAERHPGGGWVALATPLGQPLSAAAFRVADDGRVLWGRGDVRMGLPGDPDQRSIDIFGDQYPLRMAVGPDGDIVLLIISADSAQENGVIDTTVPVALRLDEDGHRLARTALTRSNPIHANLVLGAGGAAFVAITTDVGDLYLHRLERGGSPTWIRALLRRGFRNLSASQMSTDEAGNLWFVVTSGERDQAVAHLCRMPSTGESTVCLKPQVSTIERPEDEPGPNLAIPTSLAVRDGRAYVTFDQTASQSLLVCDVPAD